MDKITLQPGETCAGKCLLPIHECPNMKPREHDTDMEKEHYNCAVCGRHDYLDYEEMK